MTKNSMNFGTGQGNHGYEPSGIKGAVLLIGVALLILMGMFKNKINRRFNSGRKILFFKTKEAYFQTIGIIALTIYMVRWVIFIVTGYPMHGENLNLHLCRILGLIIFLLISFRRFELVKYFVYLSIAGFFFGMVFAGAESHYINNIGDYNAPVNGIAHNKITGVDHHITILERIFIKDGYDHYHVGMDNIHFYESYMLHLAILLLPIYIMISFGYKMSIVEYHRFNIYGVSFLLFIGLLNIILGQSSDIHGRSNFGYVGMDSNNDMKSALGGLSAWPQNFFSYAIISLIIPSLLHLVYVTQDKLTFFEDGKFVQKTKSVMYYEAKAEYKRGFKSIFMEALIGKRKK